MTSPTQEIDNPITKDSKNSFFEELKLIVWPNKQQLFSEAITVILMISFSAFFISNISTFFNWLNQNIIAEFFNWLNQDIISFSNNAFYLSFMQLITITSGVGLISLVLLHTPIGDGLGGIAASGSSMFTSASNQTVLTKITWSVLGLFGLSIFLYPELSQDEVPSIV